MVSVDDQIGCQGRSSWGQTICNRHDWEGQKCDDCDMGSTIPVKAAAVPFGTIASDPEMLLLALT